MSAGVGSGHNRAADALNKASKLYFDNVESKWEDALKYTTRVFRACYSDSYLFVTNAFPSLWGIIYKLASNRTGGEYAKDIVKAIDQIAYHRVIKMVIKYQPDAIVCTHFLPANVILGNRGGKTSKIPVYTVITDYDAHPFWVNRAATGYFVASDEVKCLLARQNYPVEKITVTGIPTDPIFSQNSHDVSSLKTNFGLKQNVPVVLFTSGGYGSDHMKKAMERILKIKKDFQLLIIAGRNKNIQEEMEKLASSDNRVRVYGFVRNMQDFMRVSDFIVAKSGGLTVAESLAVNLPMVVYSPTPGQEERNCDYLLENGVAVKAVSLDTIDYKIKLLLDNPEKLKEMRKNARSVSNPNAAKKIIGHIIDRNK